MSSIATQSIIIAFGVNLFLTFYVLMRHQSWNRALNRSFAVLSFAFALWNLGAATGISTVIYTGVFMTPPALYLFLVTLLRRTGRQRRTVSSLLITTSFTLVVISYWILNGIPFNGTNLHLLNALAAILSLSVFSWGAYRVGNRMRLTKSNRERARLMYVLAGMTAAAVAGISAVLTTLGFPLQSWSAVCGLIYTV